MIYVDSMTEYVHLGPGLFGCNVPVEWSFSVHATERYKPVDNVLYSDNLLINPGFKVAAVSDYLKYYVAMQPMSPINFMPVLPANADKATIKQYGEMTSHYARLGVLNNSTRTDLPWLASTIPEALTMLACHPRDDVYFAPIGKMFTGAIFWASDRTFKEFNYVLPMRELIVCEKNELLTNKISEHFPHWDHPSGRWLYFYCSIATTGRFEINVTTPTGMFRGKLMFQPDVVLKSRDPYVKIVGNTMLIADCDRSIAYCRCLFLSDTDRAKVVSDWYKSSYPSLMFLRDLQAFTAEGACTCNILEWANKSASEIVSLARPSEIRYVRPYKEHCKVFDPMCTACYDQFKAVGQDKFECGHQRQLRYHGIDQQIAFKPSRTFKQGLDKT